MANLGFGVTPITPNELLSLIETQLKEAGDATNSPDTPGAGLGADAFLSLWPDQWHLDDPKSRAFVAIRPNRFPIWQSIIDGSGTPTAGYAGVTHVTGFRALVTMACFVQINADPENKSVQAMTEDVLSVTSFVTRVVAALQMWTPRNSENDQLLREPGRVADPGFTFKPVGGRDGWWVPVPLECEFAFSCRFPNTPTA